MRGGLGLIYMLWICSNTGTENLCRYACGADLKNAGRVAANSKICRSAQIKLSYACEADLRGASRYVGRVGVGKKLRISTNTVVSVGCGANRRGRSGLCKKMHI